MSNGVVWSSNLCYKKEHVTGYGYTVRDISTNECILCREEKEYGSKQKKEKCTTCNKKTKCKTYKNKKDGSTIYNCPHYEDKPRIIKLNDTDCKIEI